MARRVISTHFWRRTARNALHDYEQLQVSERPESKAALAALQITPATKLKVERAYHEKGRWRVVAS